MGALQSAWNFLEYEYFLGVLPSIVACCSYTISRALKEEAISGGVVVVS